MRASWSQIVTAILAATVLAAAVGLPGTLVGRKAERAVRIPAPPVVARTVVPATAGPTLTSEHSPRPRALYGPRAELVTVRARVAAPSFVVAPPPVSPSAPTPAPPATPEPAPAPPPAPPPSAPPASQSTPPPPSQPPAASSTPSDDHANGGGNDKGKGGNGGGNGNGNGDGHGKGR